jgi:diguanylate cyclase
MAIPDAQTQGKIKVRKAGFVMALYMMAFVAILCILLYHVISQRACNRFVEEQGQEIQEMTAHIQSFLQQTVVNDLGYLTSPKIALPILEASQAEPLAETLLELIAQQQKTYDQVRLLDTTGWERIRFERNRDGQTRKVPVLELQNKADRGYFIQSAALAPTKIYVSPMDLNFEKGSIDLPYKPIIRFVRKVMDTSGNYRGIAVVNLQAQILLDRLQSLNRHPGNKLYLLNADGWYLLGPDSASAFGFQLTERKSRSFFREFPDIWQRIQGRDSAFAQSPQGWFLSHSVMPAQGNFASAVHNEKMETWYLIMHSTPKIIDAWQSDLRLGLGITLIVLLPLLTGLGWSLGKSRANQCILHEKLIEQATRDNVTGLLNRAEVQLQLMERMAMAQRNNALLAVAFVDLNDLKRTNDTQGHKAGDAMLIGLAQVARATLRNYDLAARMGGDEFLFVFSDCSLDYAQVLMNRLAIAYAQLGEASAGKAWSFSWGCAEMQPDRSMENLIGIADKAMYAHKQLYKARRASVA